jgi:RNA polymerase sigma-70 factor (ECF subfamily)
MQHDYFQLLIKSAQRGRKNAFIDLCKLNAKKIFTLCVRMLVNKKVAEIIMIQIFKQAWENIRFVREEIAFDVWLKSIAIYTILEEIRTKKIENDLGSSTSDTQVTSSNSLEVMIMSLPEKERIIYIMNEIEGYTFQEISDFLYDYSENEIKFILRETRSKLARALPDEL